MPNGWTESGGASGVLVPPEPRTRRRRAAVPSSCPPFDLPPWNGGDGDGGGGDGGGGRGDSPQPGGEDEREGVAELGLGLALAGIATLFGIFLLAWLLMRRGAPGWSGRVLSPAPELLWLGTALLLGSSLALHSILDRPGEPRLGEARRGLALTLLFGLAFLAAQAFLWRSLGAQGLLSAAGGPGTVFFAVTGLHAVHVMAGLVVLAALFLPSLRGVAPSRRKLRLGATYWHAMGALWLVLFVTLYLAR